MSRLLNMSEKCYRILLYSYPPAHRREYGYQMTQAFRDLSRAAYNQNGAPGLLVLWWYMLVDVTYSVSIEHFAHFKRTVSMSKRSIFVWILTGLFAFITGYVNVHNDEVQAPMACILLFSFILGAVQRRTAWLRAVVIGLSIPASYFFTFAINFKAADPPRLPITTAVLVIPALVAAYAGVALNLGITPLQRRAP
jgi:hypothetical protein